MHWICTGFKALSALAQYRKLRRLVYGALSSSLVITEKVEEFSAFPRARPIQKWNRFKFKLRSREKYWLLRADTNDSNCIPTTVRLIDIRRSQQKLPSNIVSQFKNNAHAMHLALAIRIPISICICICICICIAMCLDAEQSGRSESLWLSEECI